MCSASLVAAHPCSLWRSKDLKLDAFRVHLSCIYGVNQPWLQPFWCNTRSAIGSNATVLFEDGRSRGRCPGCWLSRGKSCCCSNMGSPTWAGWLLCSALRSFPHWLFLATCSTPHLWRWKISSPPLSSKWKRLPSSRLCFPGSFSPPPGSFLFISTFLQQIEISILRIEIAVEFLKAEINVVLNSTRKWCLDK